MVFLLSIQSFKEQCINEGKKKKYLQKLKYITENPQPGPQNYNMKYSFVIPYNYDKLSIFRSFNTIYKHTFITKYEKTKIHRIISCIDSTNKNKSINIINWVISYVCNIQSTAFINYLMQIYTNNIKILLGNTILPPELIKKVISYYGYYPTPLDCLIENCDLLPIWPNNNT